MNVEGLVGGIRNIVCGAVAVLTLVATVQAAQAQTHSKSIESCADLRSRASPSGELTNYPIRTLRRGTPLYRAAQGREQADTLDFDTMLKALRISETRFEVAFPSSSQSRGWVDIADVLCRYKPLRPNLGPEAKFYIRAQQKPRERGSGEPPAAHAYASPDEPPAPQCVAGRCRKVFRGDGHFVFEERTLRGGGKRYLLASGLNLRENVRLIGWVGEEEGMLWTTAYGVRPAETLSSQFKDMICAYRSLDAAIRKDLNNCDFVAGGDRWFRYPSRMPVETRLDEGKTFQGVTVPKGRSFLHVAVPLVGVGLTETEARDLGLITPDRMGTAQPLNLDALVRFKNIDIVFAIDGTSSMQPFLDAVLGDGGAVEQIQKSLSAEPRFAETRFRFGALIYRDIAAGKFWMEPEPLPASCDDANAEQLVSKLRSVKAGYDQTDPDLFEDSLTGIKKAAEILRANCPEHLKLLIVVGDHGSQPDRTDISVESVAKALRGNASTATSPAQALRSKPILTFFVQTPINEAQRSRKPQEYDAAYQAFRSQAEGMLNRLLQSQSPVYQGGQVSGYSFMLADPELARAVTEKVGQLAASAATNEVVGRVQSGQSLIDAILNAREMEQYKAIPGFYWEIMYQGACKTLGSNCNQTRTDLTPMRFIDEGDPISVDVYMSRENITSWRNILRAVGEQSGIEQDERKALLRGLIESLGRVIGEPKYDGTESFGDYLSRQSGLPIRNRSPLLSRSGKEIENSQLVHRCEVMRLLYWARISDEMLKIVEVNNNRRPVAKFVEYDGGPECRPKQIPHVDGPVTGRKFPDTSMQFGMAGSENEIMFWIPQEYLP